MEDEPVRVIRESTRNLLKLSRRCQRDEVNDIGRQIEEISIKPTDIAEIANKLKTKSSITFAELQALKNGLMQDSGGVEVVLNTHGAIRGIVRELTGSDVNKQCAAAGCCCNLALGGGKAGAVVAKAAGPYLTAALDSLNTELAVTCAWAVGNLAGSGRAPAALLGAQGALTKLTTLLTSDEMSEASVYTLTHFAYQTRDEMSSEHLSKILQALQKKDEVDMATSQLLFYLSCHKDFNSCNISKIYQQTIIQNVHKILQISTENYTQTDRQHLVYLLRVLANCHIDINFYLLVLDFFVENNLTDCLKELLTSDGLVKDALLWFLGNLFNFNSGHTFFNDLSILN